MLMPVGYGARPQRLTIRVHRGMLAWIAAALLLACALAASYRDPLCMSDEMVLLEQ